MRFAALGPPCQQGAPLQASWSAVSLQLRFGSVDVNTGTRLLQTDTAGVDMSKLELLGAFLNERLTAAAEEILGAVKEAVEEYQSEILRSQEENERLKGLLHAAVQRLLLQPGEPGNRMRARHPLNATSYTLLRGAAAGGPSCCCVQVYSGIGWFPTTVLLISGTNFPDPLLPESSSRV